MVHISRLSEELVLWMSQSFGFIDLADRFCTGSSIMPQKKNPDVPELARGKTGRVIGHLMGLLTLMKGQPLAYNKDNQEDKEPLFDTVDTLSDTLRIFCELVQGITVKPAAMERAARRGYATATDLADYLVKKGLPFRDAHETVAHAVRTAIERGVDLVDLPLETLREFHPSIEADVHAVLTPARLAERAQCRRRHRAGAGAGAGRAAPDAPGLSAATMLLFIRHGETALNVARVLQPSDTPLNERGLAQARALATRLAGSGVVHILSSDLPRALQTAEAIAAATGAPIETTPLLHERNFGELRGRAYDTLGWDPIESSDAAPGGESLAEFNARVAQAFALAVQRRAGLHGALAVVTHGLVVRAVLDRHLALAPDQLPPHRMRNASLTIAAMAAPHVCELIDCTRHLDAETSHLAKSLSGG